VAVAEEREARGWADRAAVAVTRLPG